MAASGSVVWEPDDATVDRANLTAFAAELEIDGYDALHRWSVEHRGDFWRYVIDRLGIVFESPPSAVLGDDSTPEHPDWLPGARLNIVDSCFSAPGDAVAVVHRRDGDVHRLTYDELRDQVMLAAGGFAATGVRTGDRVGIAMPMTVEAVVAYLAIISMGAVVVSIADSFAPEEIATRLRLTDAVAVVTQDVISRGGRTLPMYEKVRAAGANRCIVVDTGAGTTLVDGDTAWSDLLAAIPAAASRPGRPGDHINILFSSGTTGEPKAIPWTQQTPVKAAMDGHFHHDIHPGDVVAWPTNLGWMMGPWLIYASLINNATIALHDDTPTGRDFGEFVAAAGVTMLGVVPSLVAAWRSSGCMEEVDWASLRVVSSTGEASNPDDMAWFVGLTGAPVVEYCGGTEIGGGYISATVLQACIPGTFTTPTLGLDLRILDENGDPTGSGEVFLVPPSIGLSSELLNRDHHEVYFAGVPDTGETLRRHGDHIERLADERLPGGRYRAQGRVDDTMNLGGIKISSAEIERTVAGTPGAAEVAAIAVPPEGGGPDRLVIYVVPEPTAVVDTGAWRAAMQDAIRSDLNPLFKIAEVVVIDALPRTASAKVMRRRLRNAHEDTAG